MLFLIFFIALGVFVATQEPPYLQENQNKNDYNSIGSNNVGSRTMIAHYNSNTPFIEKDENMVRFPVINDHKAKKKLRKSPKRTIQKIIKKNKMKSEKRKVYYSTNQRTNKPTTKIDYEKYYGSEDQNYERTTMQTQNQRRARKYSNKVSRYRMPFQSLQSKGGRRHKRDLGRELYILKDLDEMEFMKGEKDYDVVKTHVKHPW